MSVASLELCRTLHELSGWDDTRDRYYEVDDGIVAFARKDFEAYEYTDKKLGLAPAYDLGYLLRKLPRHFSQKVRGFETNYHLCVMNGNIQDDNWIVDYWTYGNDSRAWYSTGVLKLQAHKCEAAAPEDAACKLAIELFNQGILTKEGKS